MNDAAKDRGEQTDPTGDLAEALYDLAQAHDALRGVLSRLVPVPGEHSGSIIYHRGDYTRDEVEHMKTLIGEGASP